MNFYHHLQKYFYWHCCNCFIIIIFFKLVFFYCCNFCHKQNAKTKQCLHNLKQNFKIDKGWYGQMKQKKKKEKNEILEINIYFQF